MTQDKIELKKRVIDIIPVLRDAVDAVRELMVSRGIEFSMSLPGEPVYLDGDPARLQQIHWICSTTRRSTLRVAVHVELSLHACRRSTRRWSACWTTASEFRSDVEHGFRLVRASQSHAGSLGGRPRVSLTPSVRGLVEKHGGSVTAASKGEGSRLRVRSAAAARHSAGSTIRERASSGSRAPNDRTASRRGRGQPGQSPHAVRALEARRVRVRNRRQRGRVGSRSSSVSTPT